MKAMNNYGFEARLKELEKLLSPKLVELTMKSGLTCQIPGRLGLFVEAMELLYQEKPAHRVSDKALEKYPDLRLLLDAIEIQEDGQIGALVQALLKGPAPKTEKR